MRAGTTATVTAAEHEFEVGLRWAIVGAGLLVAGVVLGIAVTLGEGAARDAWWNDLAATIAPGLLPLSLALNAIGGGWIGTLLVPGLITVLLVALRRPWSAAAFVVASVVSALVVQVLKSVFARARPEEMLVVSDFGSFPSGHTANAATMAVILILLFPRAWVAVAAIGWTALMAFSRTQVHAHWLTDTVGGVLVGAGAALVVAAVFAAPVLRRR